MNDMQKIFTTASCPIAGLSMDKTYKNYTLSIKVGTYYTFDYSQISNQIHYHDSYELVMVLSGRGTFIYDKNSHILSKGDIFLSDPYVEHEIHINPTETLTVLYIFISIDQKDNIIGQNNEEKLIANFLNQHRQILHNQYQLNAYLLFFETFTQNPKYKNNVWLYRIFENFIINCLDILTINAQNEIFTNKKYETNLFEKALDYIDQNLEKKLSAQIISQAVNTSKRNLYILFRKNLDRSVHDYIYERKISLAEHYLKMNLSVTETASLVGIESLSYFNKLFNKYVKMSPREYIKEVIPRQEGYGRRHLSKRGLSKPRKSGKSGDCSSI